MPPKKIRLDYEAQRKRDRDQKRRQRKQQMILKNELSSSNEEASSSDDGFITDGEDGNRRPMTHEEKRLKRRRRYDRLRKRQMRAEVSQSLQTVEKRRERARLHMREFRKTLSEEQRKRNRDATRARRARMTPEEVERARQRDRQRARDRRAEQDKHVRDVDLEKRADDKRIRRKEKEDQLCPPDLPDFIPGETYGERNRRINREQRRMQRLRHCLPAVEDRKLATAQGRILQKIDRALTTSDEKQLKYDVTNFNRKRFHTPGGTTLEPEEEDNSTWKQFFVYEIRLEFQTQRNILCEEALEIELGPNVPVQLSPLQDPNWNTPEALEKRFSGGLSFWQGAVKYGDSTMSEQDRENQEVQNRWKGVIGNRNQDDDNNDNNLDDEDEDDEETNAILNAFNQVEIKIEADEDGGQWIDGELVKENQGNCEEDVADWIANVITGGEQQQEQSLFGDATSSSSSRSRTTKSQAIQSYQEQLSRAPKEDRARMLGRWKQLAVKKAEEEQLEYRKRKFLKAREAWVKKKPEDTEKRAKIDEERTALKEKIMTEKQRIVNVIVQELIHKRDYFSQEEPERRKARIAEYYEHVATNLREIAEQTMKISKMTKEEKEEKKKNKLLLTKNLTREEIKAQATLKAGIRMKMETAEYDLHLALIDAIGLPVPSTMIREGHVSRSRKKDILEETDDDDEDEVSGADATAVAQLLSAEQSGSNNINRKMSVKKFERAFRVERFTESIVYWSNVKIVFKKTRTEVTTYRKFMVEFLFKRRKRMDIVSESIASSSQTPEGQQQQQLEQYEWISLPEAESLQDMERFKVFVTKYGEPVQKHLKFKRFYMLEEQKKMKQFKSQKSDQYRVLSNEKYRRNYIQKKYGVTLGPGEYFDKKTMSGVKLPPKTYAAWERKKLGIESAPPPKKSTPSRERQKPGRKRKLDFNSSTPALRNQISHRNTTVNSSVDYSNSDSDAGDQGQDGDTNSNDEWVPFGAYEIDTVIRNDILNIPQQQQQQQQQNFAFSQSQQHLTNLTSATAQGLSQYTQLRSGGHHHHQQQQQQQTFQQFAQSQHQIPQLQLDTYANYANAQQQQHPAFFSTEPLNFSLQYLPNSQINLISHTNQQPPQSYGWSPSASSSQQHHHPHNQTGTHHYNNNTPSTSQTHHHSQLQHLPSYDGPTPTSSVAGDGLSIASEDVELPYSPSSTTTKRSRGRPKGYKLGPRSNTSKAFIKPSSYSSTAIRRGRNMSLLRPDGTRRDLWNNRKRRKFYTHHVPVFRKPIAVVTESPFERDPEQIRQAVIENVVHLLPKCPQCGEYADDDAELKKHIAKEHQDSSKMVSAIASIDAVASNIANKDDDALNELMNTTPTTTTTTTTVAPLPPPVVGNGEKKGKKKEKIYPCSFCPSVLEQPYNLIEHLFQTHYEAKQYKCPFGTGKINRCINLTFERNNLRDHINRAHSEIGKTSFIMGIHRPKSMFDKKKFLCLHCQESHDTYSELKEHYRNTHDKVRYCCIHCGIYLRSQDYWLDHQKLFHFREPEREVPSPIEVDLVDVFRCSECDSEFSAQSFVDEHQTKGHTLQGYLIDSTPSTATASSNDDATNNKSEAFSCRACDKKFQTREKRDEHFNNCKDRSHICYWCKYKTNSKESIAQHIKDFHPKEPPIPENHDEDYSYSHEPYKCEICKKSYLSLCSLRLHCFYTHELHKYLQGVKEQLLLNPPPLPLAPKESETNNKDKNPPVMEPPKLGRKRRNFEGNDEEGSIVSCPVCKTTGHHLHQTHKTFDKLMKRYCEPCDRLFSRPLVLVQHSEAAHGILPQDLTYPAPSGTRGEVDPNDPNFISCLCGRSFTIQEFHRHHIFFEKDTDIRTCTFCSKKFFNSRPYLTHIHEVHGVPKNTKMAVYTERPPIEKRELNQEDYDKLAAETITTTATGEITIYSCRVCLKNYKTMDYIRAHIQDCHKEDAFTRVICTKCNTTFASRNNLSKHEKYHHGPNVVRFLCPVCNLDISRMEHLRVHFKRFHPEQTFDAAEVKTVPFREAMQITKQFVCTICCSNFSSEVGLKSHITNKHFPTHFSTFCEYCGLQLSSKSMRHHIEQHHTIGNKNLVVPKRKDRLSLMEVIDMIQSIYDSSGSSSESKKTMGRASRVKPRNPVSTRTVAKKNKMKKSSVKVAKTATPKKKPIQRKEIYTSEEEEEDDDDDDDDEVLYKSDTDDSDSVPTSGEADKSDDDKLYGDEEDDEDEEEKEMKSKIPKLSSSSKHGKRNRNNDDDNSSDYEAKPVLPIIKSLRSSVSRKRSTRIIRNKAIHSVKNPLKLKSESASGSSDQGSKELVICLERCDKEVKVSGSNSSTIKKSNKPRPKSKPKPIARNNSRKSSSASSAGPSHQHVSQNMMDLTLVKDEIEEIPIDDDEMDDVNNFNMECLSPIADKWRYVSMFDVDVHIQTADDDDGDNAQPDIPEEDPFSDVHPEQI